MNTLEENTQNIETPTNQGSNKWLNVIKLPSALTAAFTINEVYETLYGYILPESASLPENVNDIFTASNIFRAITSDLSKVIPMNIFMRILMSASQNLSLTTQIKYFLAPLVAFNSLGLVNHLIKFSDADTSTKLMLRAINAIVSTGLLDYIKDGSLPRIILIEMTFIVFMKQNNADVSTLLESLFNHYLINPDSEIASKLSAIISTVAADIIIPPLTGAAVGLSATAINSARAPTLTGLNKAKNWCYSFWQNASTDNTEETTLMSTNNPNPNNALV